MARHLFKVKRGDKLVLESGETLRFFRRAEFMVVAKSRPKHKHAAGKRLTPPPPLP